MSHVGWSRWIPLTLAVQLVSFSLASTAGAEPLARGPAHKLRLELDLPIVLVAGAIASSFFVMPEARGVACAPDCDRSRINGFDRAAAGLYDPTWSAVGDIATAATLTLPLLVIVVDEGFENGLRDDLVVAEAALVTSALQVSVSYAVGRPRPRVYGDDAPLDERTDANAARSFFSGHVADTVATSVAALRTFQRLGKPILGWLVFGAGMAGSSVVALSRVASGAHFPSDVIAGAAVGTGLGILLPAIHDSGVQVLPFAQADGGGLMVGAILP